MMPASRDDWATPLAALVATVRHLTGAPAWDVPGIRAALHRARHLAPPHQLAHAAIDWAVMRPELTAPVMLEEDGPWWHTGRTPAARVTETRCTVPGHEYELAHACRSCAGDAKAGPSTTEVDAPTLSATQVQVNTRGIELIRAALTPTGDPR